MLDNISEAISNSESPLSKTYKINDSQNRIRLFTMQTDVKKNLGGGWKGSFGAKYYRISNEGKIRFLTRNEGDAIFSENPLFANGNLYKEEVPAVYALLSGGKSKWTYNAGLRGEYTLVNAFSKKLNQTIVDSTYFNLFPNAKINWQFSEHWGSNLSFARKINRPQYQNLDPFLWYLDSLTSIQGNPRLTPEFLNQLEWNLSWKSYNLKVGYTHSMNTLWSVIKPGATGENSTVFIQDNIQNRKIFLISLDVPVETKFYTAYNTIAYNFFKFEDKRPEYKTRASEPQLYVYSYHQFVIPKWFNLDITGEYFGRVSDGFAARKPYYYMTAGISRVFFDKTLDLQLQFNDFLRSARFEGNRKINTFTSDYNQRFLSHYLRLTAIWKIGKMSTFKYNNKVINEKEFNRIKK